MFRQDRWPFVPTCLSEIIDSETLAVIEAGCCERLGRALTILEYCQESSGFASRIETANIVQRWDRFCALLRDTTRVANADEACKRCDMREAQISLEQFRTNGTAFRSFPCHMGLFDATHIVRVQGRPVAMLYTGQYRPPEGVAPVLQQVEMLGKAAQSELRPDERTRLELRSRAVMLRPPPPDFEASLRREAKHIERLAEAEYQKLRYQWEQAFLDTLRLPGAANNSTNLERLRENMQVLLERVCRFLRCEYAIFFATMQEGDTVLPPIASHGLPPTVAASLPHYNWRRANLTLDTFEDNQWDITVWNQRLGPSGVRGDHSDYFARPGCILPASLGSRYRGILLLGPFQEEITLAEEKSFLLKVSTTIAVFALTDLEVRYLEQERKRWKSTAMLLTHQIGTALTPIATQIGRAKLLSQKSRDQAGGAIVDLLRRAEDLSLRLAESARQTLDGHVLQLEADDLEFERYPLSVLLANCAGGFALEAEKRHRHLILDRSVELLPQAEIDVARLTIALSNLINNALKYSYPNTTIYLRASVHAAGTQEMASAVIEIDDLGDAVKADDLERIFEQGTRGLTEAKLGRIPGSGLGLWETRIVIEAHRGEIGLTCEPTNIRHALGAAHRVIFSVRIPLYQRTAKGKY